MESETTAVLLGQNSDRYSWPEVSGLAPRDTLRQQDAPHLAALDLNAVLLGGSGQGIQGLVSGFLLVDCVLRSRATIGLQNQSPRGQHR